MPTSSFLSDNVVQNMFLRVWFHLSINPFPSGWYGVEKRGQAPKIFKNSCVKLAVKFVALSITITSGIHVLLNISSSASHVLLAVSDLSGIASGYLECWSIKQSMYLCPCDDTGSTQDQLNQRLLLGMAIQDETQVLSEFCQPNELLF
ncbi:hypothetical protein TNCV_4064511 [Trichonephila clavipes]|nr:hypothetical protein TNCV_4064511 [Trichonephila clavipes]